MRYRVDITARAEADIDRIFAWLFGGHYKVRPSFRSPVLVSVPLGPQEFQPVGMRLTGQQLRRTLVDSTGVLAA